MRKLVAILSISTLALAGTTLYFARELAARREAAARTATSASKSIAAASATIPAGPNEPANAQRGAAVAQPPPPVDMKAQARAWVVTQIPSMRETLEDPEKRAAAMRDSRAIFRRDFPRLAANLGLSEDDYSRLAELLAGQQMRGLEARYQCAIKPACDDLATVSALEPGFNQELIDLLGPDRKQRFDTYRDDMHERSAVAYLRGELPDSQPLTERQAERLTEALGDERRRILEEWEQRGATYSGGFTTRGSIYYSSTAQNAGQRAAEAAEFYRRQRERAAQVLNAEQLKVLTQIQDDMLDAHRQGWEYEEQTRAKAP